DSRLSMCLLFFFFFFQAEDGIRDFHVTGVQTCALPISGAASALELAAHVRARPGWVVLRPSGFMQNFLAPHPLGERIRRRGEIRSEERRVGKECRYRGGAGREKKK